MEPIEITVCFKPSGEIVPESLSWDGKVCKVESTGRQWQTGDGLHILITLMDGFACELLWAKFNNLWYVLNVKKSPWGEHI